MILFVVLFALWIAGTLGLCLGAAVSVADNRAGRSALLSVLAVASLVAGCTYLYQLGEVPS